MTIAAERKALFDAFIATMREEKVIFCILDGYKEEHLSSDIDFMVSPEDFRRLPEILRKLEARTGGRILQALQHESESCYYVLAKNSLQAEAGWAFLHLDACANYRIRGKRWLSAKEILRSVQERDGIPVPAVEDAFRYYLIKKIQKEKLDRTHWSYLRSLYEKAPTACLARVRDAFPVQKVAFLADCLAADDYEGFRAQLGEWKRGMKKAFHFPDFLRAIRRVSRPTGFFVVFLGPDGSGKSSVIRRVESALAPAFRRTHTAHLKPGLCCRRRTSVMDASRPHAQASYGPVASLGKLFFFWLDYALGFWRRIFPKLVRSTLVLYDRYYPDILVDPRRYRYGGPGFLAEVLGNLLPRPDLWILLDAPTEVLQERKQEVSPDETARQRARYRRVIRSLGGHVVSAAQPLDAVVAEVNLLIADHLEQRFRS